MFEKGQLVRNKLTGNLFEVIESNLIWLGFVEVNSVADYWKGLVRKRDLELIGNNFKFKGAK